MEILGNKIQQNSAMKYYCIICHYGTSRKCNFDTHLISTRHCEKSAKEVFGNEIQQKFSKIQQICEKCNKGFKTSSGLWKHKQKCNPIATTSSSNEPSDKELIMMLIKENSELSSQYNKLVIEAMGGKGDNDYEKDTKIIKKIAKVVGIDKN